MARAALEPVAKESLAARATQSLREYILSGALAPGSRLTEIPLAEQLGIARTTVRASLNQLAFEGIVVKVPYTGWHVAELTAEAAWEIWTLRGSLESLAARVAAQHLDKAAAARLRQAHQALLDACRTGSAEDMSSCDFRLHRTIVELADHELLAAQYELVEHKVRFYIVTSDTFVAEGGQDVARQHRPLVRAILAGDAERAAQEAWLHNESEGRRLAAWLERPRSRATHRPR